MPQRTLTGQQDINLLFSPYPFFPVKIEKNYKMKKKLRTKGLFAVEFNKSLIKRVVTYNYIN